MSERTSTASTIDVVLVRRSHEDDPVSTSAVEQHPTHTSEKESESS